MGIKGWSLFRFRSKHLSVFLTVFVGTTILLWAWENSPLFISLLSPQDQFLMRSSETLRDTTTRVDSLPSTDLKVQTEKTVSDSLTTSKTRERAEGVDLPLQSSSDRDSTKTIADDTISPANEKVSSNLFTKTETREHTDGVNVPPTTSDTKFTNSKADDTEYFGNGKAFSESTTENRERTEGVNVPPPSLPASNSTKDCNYAKGKWVADSRRPLYSGFGCKQWLSQMWACRLTQRTDFSYEAFRWQPQNCRMPEFERSEFLQRMKGKTIAFVGDSLGRQQFQSLMCMVSGGEDVPDIHNIGRQYGLVKARGAVRPDGWAYRFPSTNTVILYYWSATLCDLEPLNVTDRKTEYALHLDRPAAFLSKYLHTFDVLILNTGHHWNRGKFDGNRWVMYVNGVPNTDAKLAQIGNAKELAIRSVVKWLDSQLPQFPKLKAFFRTISPRHFLNGDWNTGGTCDNTVPLAGGNQVLQDKSSDPVIESAVNGSRIKILDITAISQLRDDGHISRYTIRPVEGMQDCLHWCLPGIPDTWNELLYAQL